MSTKKRKYQEQNNAHNRERYRTDEEFRERVKAHAKRNLPLLRARNFRWLEEYKSHLSCSVCGENHVAALDFHHPDSDAKNKFSLSKMAGAGYSILKLEKEIAKCVVLCSNCHRKLHWEQRQ